MMNNDIYNAYSALFANAQNPNDQAEVRKRYASALLSPQQPFQMTNAVADVMKPAAPEPQIPDLARGSSVNIGALHGGTGGPGWGHDGKDYTRRLRDLIFNPGSFQKTPGFRAAMDTGTQAIQRQFAARGMGNSGNVLHELMKFGIGLGNQEYGNQVDRLTGLSKMEQTLPDYWRGV